MKREFRAWTKWECFPAGFYAPAGPAGKSHEDCEQAYVNILGNADWFRVASFRVMNEWPNSCAHFLTNEHINRVAWLGQAAVCIMSGVPSRYKYAFLLLTPEKQESANEVARRAIHWWENNRRAGASLFGDMGSEGLQDRNS